MTRNERALKIAEYEGWSEYNKGDWINPEMFKGRIQSLDVIEDLYSSFNGLMPIVCEINKSSLDQRNKYSHAYYIQIRADIAEVVEVFTNNRGNSEFDFTDYPYTDAESLIDALQEAIIFYYENREV